MGVVDVATIMLHWPVSSTYKLATGYVFVFEMPPSAGVYIKASCDLRIAEVNLGFAIGFPLLSGQMNNCTM